MLVRHFSFLFLSFFLSFRVYFLPSFLLRVSLSHNGRERRLEHFVN